MPEKVKAQNSPVLSHPWNLRSNPFLHWRFAVLTTSLFIGMLIVWTIDGCTIKSFVESWKSRKDFQLIVPPNLTQNPTNIFTESPFQVHNASNVSLKSTKPSWISLDLEPNFTSILLSRWLVPTRDSKTVDISVPDLDNQNPVELSTGKIHEFIFHAKDESDRLQCTGGDYFETELNGESWTSRPPVKDLGNGSYTVSLQVHPDFAGAYNFTMFLLFRRFEGLKFSPERFAYDKLIRRFDLKFHRKSIPSPELKICDRKADFTKFIWSGRWTRHGKNDSCQISNDGRYRCLRPEFPCPEPWCKGPLGLLESNGWVYSAHCSFKIFLPDSAWDCLRNRWIFFWGDSNHVDTIRNLLNFVLDLPNVQSVPRRFDLNFTNPKDPSQSVRITSMFNGHWNETQNYQGLNSLKNEAYRNLVKRFFQEETVPDTIISNSGLHDGVFWSTIRRFTQGAEYAASFWAEVIESVKARGLKAPEFIYRTTVATGGYARRLAFNPNKMETFNMVFLEKLREKRVISGLVDGFDMTFPWHFDNRCNDGVHYGRAPLKMRWRDGQIGHQYFVDLMLAHVLLNALCAT